MSFSIYPNRGAMLMGKRDISVLDVHTLLSYPDSVLVDVAYCGLCGSDLQQWLWGGVGNRIINFPKSIGHEASGTIELDGESVRVAISPSSRACGTCSYCMSGRSNLCSFAIYMGASDAGAMRQKAGVSERQLFPIPDSISLKDAVLIEPLAVAIHAVRLVHSFAPSILVVGLGGIGRLIIEAAHAEMTTEIWASDILDYRVRMLPPYATRYNGQAQVDVAFDAAGTDRSLAECLSAVKPGGTVVVVGIPASENICYNPHQARIKEVNIIHSRRFCDEFPKAIQMVASGRANLSGIVTHTFPLEKVQEAFETAAHYRDGVLRAVIEMPGVHNG